MSANAYHLHTQLLWLQKWCRELIGRSNVYELLDSDVPLGTRQVNSLYMYI